jgi:hypothetical protein
MTAECIDIQAAGMFVIHYLIFPLGPTKYSLVDLLLLLQISNTLPPVSLALFVVIFLPNYILHCYPVVFFHLLPRVDCIEVLVL